MPATHRFLIVDDHGDSRFLLAKTLYRKFPRAVFHECPTSETAFEIAKSDDLSAVITHRTADMGGIRLVRELRRLNPTVPIVMVSSQDQKIVAIACGADRFLHYDEWLRIGTIVEEMLPAREASVVGRLP
ncbi:MAG TPA: response regulator [Opitutaceae bacterium]|nr:response regulator [Opitutaceae bacterium]